jgi:hypothetical protein
MKNILLVLICFCNIGLKCQTTSLNPIQISYRTIDLSCYSDPHSGIFIINNKDDLYKYTDCVFSDMDFEKCTYIGIAGGCDGPRISDVDLKIVQDFNKKIYFVDIVIRHHYPDRVGNTRMSVKYNYIYQKLISVLKLRNDYEVKFSRNQLYNQ